MRSTASVATAATLSFMSATLPAAAADRLEQVIVTATRTAQSLEATLASVTTFDRDDIERQQARSVEDLLRSVEGLSIANNGGPGKPTSFFVRGTESDHVLVLIDGIKVGSATVGTVAFQNLPIEQIERVEFVRGPRSSLYGSEAIGGVLQLFTRRGGGNLTPSFSVSGGSFGTRQIDAAVGGGGDRAWFNLRGSYQDIDGFDACRGSSRLFAGCFTEEPDDDSYQYRSAAIRAGYRFDRGGEIESSLLRADSNVKFDGSFTNEGDVTQQIAGLRLRQPIGSRATLSVNVGRAWDQSDNFLNGVFRSRFDTVRDSATLQSDVALTASQTLSVGADYQNDEIDSSTRFVVKSRDNKGFFAQYLGNVGPLRIEASARRDDNAQFGSSSTGALAVGYAFSPAFELIAQHGTAFKAPTFNELYFPGFGNPDLAPERARSTELAARGQVRSARWRLSAYETRIRDLVGFDARFSPVNIDLARIEGIEGRLDLSLGSWNLGASAAWLDPQNASNGPNRGKTLPRRAISTTRVDLDRRFTRGSLGATVIAEGARFDNLSNSRRLGGYATLDLRGELALNDRWRLQARAANLFDRSYETAEFYNQPGRALYLTARFSPGER